MRETGRHRKAFERYFRLGPERSLARLHEALAAEAAAGGRRAPSLRTLEQWSSGFGWRARLNEYEREARNTDRKLAVDAIREMNERQAKEGLLLQQRGAERLMQLAEADVDVRTAIKMVSGGTRIEREARGAAGHRADKRSDGPAEVIHELHLHLGGPQELYMFPDPDS